MKLVVTQQENTLSSTEFNDKEIAQKVEFWANAQHQSPQFPLDLTPDILQKEFVYPGNLIPTIYLGEEVSFHLEATDEITNISIVQLCLRYIGNPVSGFSMSEMETLIQSSNENIISKALPDGSIYLIPTSENINQINIAKIEENELGEATGTFEYSVLFSFQTKNIEKTYFALIDPLTKITSTKKPT